MKHATNTAYHHVSGGGHCWKVFKVGGQRSRSKVKCILPAEW